MLLHLLHGQVQAAPLDVEVATGRAQVRVPQQLADEVCRDAGFIEARAGLVPQISELQPSQPGGIARALPRLAHGRRALAQRIAEHVRVRAERRTRRIEPPRLQHCHEPCREGEDAGRSGLRLACLDDEWRWCMARPKVIVRPTPACSPTDGRRLGPAKLDHLVQDVARKARFDAPPPATTGAKCVSDDGLVPKEGVLCTGLQVVARCLLPLARPSLSMLVIARSRAPERGLPRGTLAVRVGGTTTLASRALAASRTPRCRRPRPP